MNRQLVLIVDRDKDRGALLGQRLEKRSLEARYASSLTEAQHLISQERYRLVVLYLNGKHRKACQFCRQVCQDSPFLRVVAVLPEMDPEAEMQLFDNGVVDVAAAGQVTPAILSKRINLLLSPPAVRPFQKP